MPNEVLVAEVKKILGSVKTGKLDDAYRAYAALFASDDFAAQPSSDRRSVLKLMILAKGVPQIPTPLMIEAHKVALAPITALVAAEREPVDYELLGVCQVVLGDEKSAAKTFQEGLTLERARNPQSDLCGALMKRVASV